MTRIRVRTNLSGIARQISRAKERTQYALDTQILKDDNEFIPADTWNLRDSSIRGSIIGQGILQWSTPYARNLYYNPQYNFSLDKNPKAGGLWHERAKAAYGDDWTRLAQKEMEDNL
ncbi:minor capsid protein [Niallia sp. FSL W8-0951]|uniref:minor capsid protein n=1 Tax=Niallia sp. FSL W8-0951 TaxID=2954639 RepID=UPI0030F6A309